MSKKLRGLGVATFLEIYVIMPKISNVKNSITNVLQAFYQYFL